MTSAHPSGTFNTTYVRSVSGRGARCGCGGMSVLHVGTDLHEISPGNSRFLCRTCAAAAVDAHFAATGQSPYWPGDEARDESYKRPEADQ